MKAKIYKGKKPIGTVELLKGSKLIFDIEDKEDLNKIRDLYTKPYETSILEDDHSKDIVVKYSRRKFEPKTKEHFEALSSELWRFGYGGLLEE